MYFFYFDGNYLLRVAFHVSIPLPCLFRDMYHTSGTRSCLLCTKLSNEAVRCGFLTRCSDVYGGPLPGPGSAGDPPPPGAQSRAAQRSLWYAPREQWHMCANGLVDKLLFFSPSATARRSRSAPERLVWSRVRHVVVVVIVGDDAAAVFLVPGRALAEP